MIIYTGNADGESLDKVERLGLGIMIASSPNWEPRKGYSRVPCALDNGAFQCSRRGFPFMEKVFISTLEKAYKVGISLNFIVCPDIVGGGKSSLDLSMDWAEGRLRTAPNLALAVQDGMEPTDVTPGYHLPLFSHIFVGGTPKWKWVTAKMWIEFAHKHGKMCHVGQCGTLDRIRWAEFLGADSVDSTSIVRNRSWHIIEQWRSRSGQLQLDTQGGDS